MFDLLKVHARTEGHAAPPSSLVVNGERLGQWVVVQRQARRRGELTRDRLNRLQELPGWVWHAKDAAWQSAFLALTAYIEETGHAAPPVSYRTDGGRKLGGWVVEQRTRYRNNELSAERVEWLESLPGWVWNVADADWETAYSALFTYARQFGSATPPATYVTDDGLALGMWVATRRLQCRRGSLPALRKRQLEELPGWVWSPLDADWEAGYQALADYAGQAGHAAPPAVYVAHDGFRLGGWVRKQRERHRQHRLPEERRHRLEALDGWLWSLRSGPRGR